MIAVRFRVLRLLAGVALAASLPLGAMAAPPASDLAPPVITVHADPAASLTGVEFFIPAGRDRQRLREDGLAALTAAALVRTPVTVTVAGETQRLPLDEAIAAHGGSLEETVEGERVRLYVETLPRAMPQALDLLHDALANPDFSPAAIARARAVLERRFERDQSDALRIGTQMLDRAWVQDSGAGMLPYGTPASLAWLDAADVRSFFERSYRRAGTIASAVGAFDDADRAALQQVLDALRPGSAAPVRFSAPTLTARSRQLIAYRAIGAPWMVVRYAAPSLRDPDAPAMFVLAALLQESLRRASPLPATVSTAIVDRAIGTIYTFDDRHPSLDLFVDGGLGEPERLFETTLTLASVLDRLSLTGSLDGFERIAAGDLLLAGDGSLQSQAWWYAVLASQGLPADERQILAARIRTVTPVELQRVARRYLARPILALVLPRNVPAAQN